MQKKIIPLILIFLISSAGTTPAGAEEKEILKFDRVYPREFYHLYTELFHPETFPLLGKLLTFFLKDEDRGFIIKPQQEKTFSIQSKNTIQEESTITLNSWEEKKFSFSADLLLQRIVTFSTEMEVEVYYEKIPAGVRGEATISYSLPRVIEGANELVFQLTGHNFIEENLKEFLDELHALGEDLDGLTPQSWKKRASDPEYLQKAAFPLSFSQEEKERVARIIESFNKDGN